MAGKTVRVDCVNKAEEHSHILSVGTKFKDGSGVKITTYTVAEVYAAIENGGVFYTVSPSTNAVALVHPFTCKEKDCTAKTLRSASDAVIDNNLDNISSC